MNELKDFLGQLFGGSGKENSSSPEKNPLKTKEGARSYMLESTSYSDWESRATHVVEVNDHLLPAWWMGLIISDADLVRLRSRLKAEQEKSSVKRRY